MIDFDWRELYARNQAAIAAGGIRLLAMPAASDPPTSVRGLPDAVHHKRPRLLRKRSPATGAPARDAGARSPRHGLNGAGAGALVHVPAGLDPEVPAAIVCMLHGCTQDPAAFAAATAMNEIADRHGFVVVYPAQPRGANASQCWNWFLPAHQRRGSGEPATIVAGLRQRIAEAGQAVDPARLFVAGLSSGGAMALILAACYPDVFAAVAVHSGLPYRSAHDLASAFAVMRDGAAGRAADGRAIHAAMGRHARPIPTMVIHGTADSTVAPDNGRRVLAQAMQANHLAAPGSGAQDPARPATSQHGRAEGGLSYTLGRWLDPHGRLMHECIEVQGLGHAWSGGTPGGSYSDPRGPSASQAIWAFFDRAVPGDRPPSSSSRPRSRTGSRLP